MFDGQTPVMLAVYIGVPIGLLISLIDIAQTSRRESAEANAQDQRRRIAAQRERDKPGNTLIR